MKRKAYWHITVWGDGKELESFFTNPMTEEEAKEEEKRQEEKWKKCYGSFYKEYSAYAGFWEWE